MTEEEMALFEEAQVAAGYLLPERTKIGEGWLHESDHDRFVGWQFGRLQERERVAAWACERWRAEVASRPLENKHRRTLDDAWRQVIRFTDGDPDCLIGPAHDVLVAGAQDHAARCMSAGFGA